MSTHFHGFQFSRTWCNSQEMGLYKSDTLEYFASSSVLQHAICFIFQTNLVRESVGEWVFPGPRRKFLDWTTLWIQSTCPPTVHHLYMLSHALSHGVTRRTMKNDSIEEYIATLGKAHNAWSERIIKDEAIFLSKQAPLPERLDNGVLQRR